MVSVCLMKSPLRKKCPYLQLFWSFFSLIRTEFREILRISLYSVRMRKNTDQNNSEYWHFLRNGCVLIFHLTQILLKPKLRKFHSLYAKNSDNATKSCYFVRFQNSSKNMFVNISEENYFLFPNNVAKIFIWAEKFKDHWNQAYLSL